MKSQIVDVAGRLLPVDARFPLNPRYRMQFGYLDAGNVIAGERDLTVGIPGGWPVAHLAVFATPHLPDNGDMTQIGYRGARITSLSAFTVRVVMSSQQHVALSWLSIGM